jgi:hypothetical protein
MEETQYGLPLLVANFEGTSAQGLKRIRFHKGQGKDDYRERWLQEFVSRHPNVLPIEQIEPALTPAIPVCMEMKLSSGFVDNLFATPNGDLIVGETKLFRNPEARREVIGQIIDYAKDLSALTYEQLDQAISQAEAPDGAGGHPKASLYETVASVAGREETNEAQFIDAVSRNLERGRFLLLIIGDGIQSGTENISAFLQQHAGIHFTLGLVELAIFEMPAAIGGYLVQPRVIARTRNIDRGIVTIENGKIAVKPPADQTAPAVKTTSITEEKFYEELAASLPAVVPALKAFRARLEEIGVRADFGRTSMLLKWRPDEQRAWNFGAIMINGKVWTDAINLPADTVGRLDLSHDYLQRLASFIKDAYVKKTPRPTTWFVAKGGTYVTIDQLLAHEDEWYAAIEDFMAKVTDALKDQ